MVQQATQKKLHHHTIILAKRRRRFFKGIIASVVVFEGEQAAKKVAPFANLNPDAEKRKAGNNLLQQLQLVIKRVSGKQPPREDTVEAGVFFLVFKLGLYTRGCSSKKNGLEKCTPWDIMTCIFMHFNIICVKSQ